MCKELLRALADAKLPFTVVDTAQIDRLRILDAARYIKAFIPSAHVDWDNRTRQEPATVIEITSSGRKALRQDVDEDIAKMSSQRSTRSQTVDASRDAPLNWWSDGRRRRAGA